MLLTWLRTVKYSLNHYIRVDRRLNKLIKVSLLFLLSIGIGISGFMFIEENYTFIDAFYMTVITIATVGFTEVHPLSDAGRLFTSFYIVINLGIFALFASVLTTYLFEGELREILNNYNSIRKVNKMKDHVIVCGFGRNGIRACEELQKNNIPFVVVEQDPELLKELAPSEIVYIEGDATHDEILKTAGVERAQALITTLPKDADSVFVTLTARQMNTGINIVARANETSAESKLIRAGANRLVRPDLIGGTYMANLITKPGVVEFLDMISGTGELKLEEFSFEDMKENFREKSIMDLDIRKKSGATIMAFKAGEKRSFMINPHPSTKITNGDVMIVLGTEDQIKSFANYYTTKKLML
nr:potassium channel protein [Microscilla marina]